jgi:hypothetical protein
MITTSITYDNFTFKEPIPLVSKNEEIINYGDRWGQITKISLQGQLTGVCPNDFNQLISGQNNLISGFSRDFKPFTISENGKTIFTSDTCTVRSINFDQSKYVKMLNYTIELDCYERDLFTQSFGVLDPVNEYTFTENEDQSLTINHNISAKGINTSTFSAMDNARNYVYALTGYNPSIIPININNSNYTPLLRSYTENINRLNGTYGIQESYVVDISNNAYINPQYFTRYTTTINKSINTDFDSISIQGSIQGAKRTPFSGVRYYASGLNLFNICANDFGSSTQLNNIPISLSFDENQAANTINFNATYDTNIIYDEDFDYVVPNSYFDANTDISKDTITSITSVSISGPIVTRGGNLKQKYESAKTLITEIISAYGNIPTYLYTQANTAYSKVRSIMNIPSAIILNSNFRSFSITDNPEKGEISLSATFDDKDQVIGGNDIKSNSFEVSYEPKIDLFRPRPTYNINGFYVVYELGEAKKLATANVNSTTEFKKNTSTDNAKANALVALDYIKDTYVTGPYILLNETANFDQTKYGETKSSTSSLSYSKQNSANDTDPVFVPAKIKIIQ